MKIRRLPRWLRDKESACHCRRHERRGFNPWAGRSPEEGNGNPLQYSCLENSMDKGAWWATVHGCCKGSHVTEQLTLFTVHLAGLLGKSGIKAGVLHRASLWSRSPTPGWKFKLTTAKTQRRPKCPATDDWFKMCVHIHIQAQWNMTRT